MPKSPEEMAAAMLANMEEKTGKRLEHWLKVVKKTRLAGHRQILNHLKSEHGITSRQDLPARRTTRRNPSRLDPFMVEHLPILHEALQSRKRSSCFPWATCT